MRLAGMGDQAGKTAHEINSPAVKILRQSQNTVNKLIPPEMGLFAQEKNQLILLIVKKGVFRLIEPLNDALFDFYMRTKQRGKIHRTGKIINVKIIRLDFRQFSALPGAAKIFHRAG